uniref:Uncharacterized protein n=1 Tax=Panagrellus redivivus TaxID=6233 RepID=A0A7E4VRC0_PANRE
MITENSEKEIADNKTLVKKHYRWTLETEVNEFETFLRQNNIDLKDKLTISQYNRLIQVCNDGNHQPEKWKVVMELTKRLNCDDPHAIAGLMEIVNERIDADYINNNPNPKAKTLYKRNQTTALLDGLKNNSEDAFVNKIEERINHFKTRYENGDENLANFHEVAAEAGAEAAAYEAYGHGLKKFHKTYKGNPPPGENQDDWIETYLRRGTRGDVALSQDGLFWKPKPTPMVNSPPQPVP